MTDGDFCRPLTSTIRMGVMPKTLLIGPAGCGKTRLVLNDFSKALRVGDPFAPDVFFIVPSAEHTERVTSLLVQGGVKGYFHKRVTTLSRFVSGLFQVTDVPVASSLTRAMIVKDLFSKNSWEYFKEVKDQPGFLNLFLQFIAELKESCMNPVQFRAQMNGLKKFEPAFGAKYEALAAVYEAYEGELKARGLRDEQDGLAFYLERQNKGAVEPLKFRSLWFDGFFDFSNLQLEYLKVISSMTGDMTITLTKEEGAGREEAFEIIETTQKSLESLGLKTLKMKAGNFRTKDPALLHLQKNLFNEKPKTAPVSDTVTFLDAIGTEGEIELIARKIHELYAAGGYRYSDFAVLFRQVRDYGRLIASIFSKYGIPAEVHERERLKFSSWIAAATGLLTIFCQGWRRDDVLAFLKSSHVKTLGEKGKDEEWLANFEIRVFEEGILESRDSWLKPWRGRNEKESSAFNKQKEEMLAPLVQLEEKFRAAADVEEHIRIFKESVYRLFGILEISDESTVSVRRDAAAVRRFETLLEEIRANVLKVGSRTFLFEAFADQFLNLVDIDVYSLHERDKNRVQVYDVSLSRQKEYKVVFVAGLLEKVFPLQIREDALLSDWERRILNAGLDHPLRERLPRQSLERYLFYLAVTRASERLFLSYPHADLEGRQALPSFFLEEVKNLFNGEMPMIKQSLSRPYPSPETAITQREREAALMGRAREEAEKNASKMSGVRFAEVFYDSKSRERIFSALAPVEAKLESDKICQGEYFKLGETSPTRLEDYARCPYHYFSRRILKLQDPTEDLTVKLKGTVLHWVLEEYFREFIRSQGKKISPAEFTEKKLKEAFEKYPLFSERKYREELDRADVRDMLLSVLQKETERLETAGLTPAYVEYGFGSEPGTNAPALKIDRGDKPVKVRGRIDRIDLDKEKKLALVMDYKRTAKFDKSALEFGIALQLPLYILAVEKNLGLKSLGGQLYSLKKNKATGFYNKDEAAKIDNDFTKQSLMSADDFRKVLDRTVEFVKRFAEEIEGLTILVRPRDIDFCERLCPYQPVCRIEKWRLPMILQDIKDEEAVV